MRDLYPEGSLERRHLQPHSAAAYSEAQAPLQPEQPVEVEDLRSFVSIDEEESVDSWGDVAEDSADQEQANGLQAVLAASPEN